MDLLNKYIKEISEEVQVDRLNMTEFSMLVPSKKHFWIARLFQHKSELITLKKKKNLLIKELAKNSSSPVKLSNVNASKMAENDDIVQQLNDKITETELIVEYLEKTEKLLSNLTYDVKNIIAAVQLETM